MNALVKVSKRVKISSIVLIIITGLLNFHPPHFLLEQHKNFGNTSPVLGFGLLVLVIAAIISAIGIYRNRRWGWVLGIIVAFVSFLLWIAQETIGLPGLPKMWFEPSRIVAFIIEGVFVVLAYYQL